ncbi:MAG: hypothetical protein ACFFC6_03035 [Promethearchaeota archaeon]
MNKLNIIKPFLYIIGFLISFVLFIRVIFIGSILLYQFAPRGDIIIFLLILAGFSISIGVFIWVAAFRGPSDIGITMPTHLPTPLWD